MSDDGGAGSDDRPATADDGAPAGTPGRPLDSYRHKRTAGRTPEPVGRPDSERPGLFVVQQHAARNLHWDLRLEISGVLRSWAVPKGPSLSPDDKRLAVATEDHPVEYADFEGVIPEGEYGAGSMIVWDRGPAVHELDPVDGLETGKLLFRLKGYKLRGLWTLVRTHKDPRQWLLIKKPDEWATGETVDEMSPESVLSGLTTDELAAGSDRAAAVHAELDELGAGRGGVDPEGIEPMLAMPSEPAFSRPGWLFELKYDGYRVLASTERAAGPTPRDRVRLAYRSGRDASATFPDLARALAALPYASLVLDGEVVVLDDEARPRFALLQQRAQLVRRADVERAAVRLPATYYVFDLLVFEGRDLRPLPLAERKRLLARVLPAAGPLRFADHVEERGEELFAAVRQMGLEGLVAKRADAPYTAGRQSAWVKIRADRTGDFVVVGWTDPQGSRSGFGALHLGALDGPRLVYVGRVGSGFGERLIGELERRLGELARDQPPLTGGEIPSGAEHHWVEPRLVAEVRYSEVTPAGQLRQPVFLRLRDDKRPEDCLLANELPTAEEPPEAPPEPPRSRPEVEPTRPEKVFWPDDGLTKGELFAYYRAVAPLLLPYLADRPLVLDRYPDGIEGKSFYQKNAPDYTPDWVRTEAVWSEDSGSETRYFVCDDEATLLWLVNMGTIPLHVWSSRVETLQHPDWCILDLDAKDAPFAAAVEVALALHRLAGELGLEAFVKTSGASGLHVLFPVARLLTHAQSRQLAELVARFAAAELPEAASVARLPSARPGKVYVDYLQNGYGKLLVAPYSVRPLPGAPVSTPLAWDEVGPGLDPADFTVRTAPARFAAWDADPLSPVLETKPDLLGALGKLAERVE